MPSFINKLRRRPYGSWLARTLAVWFSLALAAATTAHQVADVDRNVERAKTLLERSTQPRSNGEFARLLRGLRQLRDPALLPLFSTLSQHDHRLIRMHGILGMAELSEPPGIDPGKLMQLDRPGDQALVLEEAVSAELAGPDLYRELLSQPTLDPSLRVTLWILMVNNGHAPPIAEARALLSQSDSPAVKLRAALLLMHAGDCDEACREALDEVAAMPDQLRHATVVSMLQALRRYPLNVADWVEGWIDRAPSSAETGPILRFESIYTLLKLDPKRGVARWQEAYAAQEGMASRLRYALALLDVAQIVPPEAFDPVRAEEAPFLSLIGEAGAAVAKGWPAVAESTALIRQHHPLLTAWVLDRTERLDPEPASDLLAALIADSLEDGAAINERLDVARVAASRLLPLDAARLRGILDEAGQRQRRLTEEAILLGALDSGDAAARELVDGVERWGSVRSGSLAVIVQARFSDDLDSDDLYRLSLAFAAGNVAPEFQVQAAWLYLKATGRVEEVLASVLGGLAPRSGGS